MVVGQFIAPNALVFSDERGGVITQNPLSLTSILLVEDDPAILDFHCDETGVLLWPYVRSLFFRMMLSDLYYSEPLIKQTTYRNMSIKAIQTLGKSAMHNLRMRFGLGCNAEICLMATGIGNSLVDGRWFNRLCDYFALAFPSQTLVVEDQYAWLWTMPKHTHRVIFRAPMQVRHALVGRLLVGKSHVDRAAGLLGLVRGRARRLLDWELGQERESILVRVLAEKAAALPYVCREYRSMLRRIRPKILIKEDACYGQYAALMSLAAEMGIVTAEFQHGAVSAGHDAYNIAPTLSRSKEYRDTLPQYFLSYGEWWNGQISLPLTKLSIGNPYRDAQLSNLPASLGSKRDVLILGDGVDSERYLSFCRFVTGPLAARGLRTVFRPHPSERAAIVASNRAGIDGVIIDESASIYTALATSHAVVSELSTGLFEAIGIADRVFMWNTGKAQFAFPDHPFTVFGSEVELLNLIAVAQHPTGGPPNALWQANWRENYLSFLRSCGVNVGEQVRL